MANFILLFYSQILLVCIFIMNDILYNCLNMDSVFCLFITLLVVCFLNVNYYSYVIHLFEVIMNLYVDFILIFEYVFVDLIYLFATS